MSRLGAKTYSRKPECRTSVQFDHLLSDKGNKPSTAKVSVAGIHRWGMTSFTSIRKARINGQKEVNESLEPVKRIKIDPKPTISCREDPFSFETDIEIPASKVLHSSSSVHCSSADAEIKPVPPKPNKFFKSGSSRLLSTASNSPKNSDFDALRLSTPSHFNAMKGNKDSHEIFLNMHTNFKNESSHSSEEQHSVFLTNTSPNIVDLRYCTTSPNACASSMYSNKPSVHYISPFIQPIVSTDASSRAFDALRTLDLSNKPSNIHVVHQLDSYKPTDYVMKKENILSIAQTETSLTGSDRMNMNHNQVISHSSEKNSISVEGHLNLTDQRLFSDSEKELAFSNIVNTQISSECDTKPQNDLESISQSQSNSGTSSQESNIVSSQSSQSSGKSEDSSAANKQQSRPKKIFSSSLKFKAVYNHRHWHSSKKETEGSETPSISLADEFEEETTKENFNDALVEEIANTSYGESRSFKCPKESKQFYTVVKNVKQAYQCHESGETQEFNDDIEYLLECVQDCNGIGTRCLSVLNLAAKCMGPAFRIHLRAHGTMPKIFSALKDAPSD
ncbi:Protein wings apart-like protein, partial [Stegodyphus mimosarum]